jgi:hypothetical protein
MPNRNVYVSEADLALWERAALRQARAPVDV